MTQINKEEPIKTIGTECNNNNANVISDTKIKDTLSRNMFKFNYVIGKGGFGKVWQVLYKKTKQPFALKEMSKTKILDKKSEKSINNEMFILKKLNHPFIVNMHYAFQDNDNLYLVIDFLSGGDLRYHCSRYRTFSEEQTRFFISCIIFGLSHIHANNIIHRDIKPENLVLDQKGYLRITDFGIARNNKKDNSTETSGTPGYMSPEVMCGNNHSFSTDYFAIGVIGFEFMMGKRPYNGKDRKEIKNKMLSKKIFLKKSDIKKGWSIESLEFINKLLERKPELRLGNNKGIKELIEHQWLKYYPWKELEEKKLPAPFIPDQNDNFDKGYCDSVDIVTDETKMRYKQIYASSKYKQAFVDFYFNIESEKKEMSKNMEINKKNNINNNTIKNDEKKNNNKNNAHNNINTINVNSLHQKDERSKKIGDLKENIHVNNKMNSIVQDKNNEKNNKILMNLRKILYESNNEKMENDANNNNRNILIKECIEGNSSLNSKYNNNNNINNNQLVNKRDENNNNTIEKDKNKNNKNLIINPTKINSIYPYINYNSNPSPTISIKNIFVNYYSSSPRNYNGTKNSLSKNKYNCKIYRLNVNKPQNQILTPPHKNYSNIIFQNMHNHSKINNMNSQSLLNPSLNSLSKNSFSVSNGHINLNKMNKSKGERSLFLKNTNKLVNKNIRNYFNVSYNKTKNLNQKEHNNNNKDEYLIRKLIVNKKNKKQSVDKNKLEYMKFNSKDNKMNNSNIKFYK